MVVLHFLPSQVFFCPKHFASDRKSVSLRALIPTLSPHSSTAEETPRPLGLHCSHSHQVQFPKEACRPPPDSSQRYQQLPQLTVLALFPLCLIYRIQLLLLNCFICLQNRLGPLLCGPCEKGQNVQKEGRCTVLVCVNQLPPGVTQRLTCGHLHSDGGS